MHLMNKLGTWIFDGERKLGLSQLRYFKEMVGDKVQVIYEPGLAYSREKNPASVAKAAAAAARADVILAFVGEESILSGEAHCLADLDLQGDQGALITALAKTGKPVVTIVMAGRPLTIGKEVEESTAVLYSVPSQVLWCCPNLCWSWPQRLLISCSKKKKITSQPDVHQKIAIPFADCWTFFVKVILGSSVHWEFSSVHRLPGKFNKLAVRKTKNIDITSSFL